MENDLSKIDYCLKNKISVIHKDIETGIQDFDNKSFDFVILSLTLQSVKNTYNILNEMLQGRELELLLFLILVFGNIAYKLCWELCRFPLRCHINGSIPQIFILCTINDFEIFCYENEVQIEEKFMFGTSGKVLTFFKFFGLRALYVLKRKYFKNLDSNISYQ